MNEYFQYERELRETENYIRDFQSSIKSLNKRVDMIKDLCNHTTKDGDSAITSMYDKIHTTYTCVICGRYGDWDWYNKIINR